MLIFDVKYMLWFFGNEGAGVLGAFGPVIRYSPDKGSGAAATTGCI
ncbi:hypothetical protein QF042_003981 [Pedobacter sp. W3I1]|nr:hypothetical protein [Pedobacter sp. W3I1]